VKGKSFATFPTFTRASLAPAARATTTAEPPFSDA
jgi:hypothetical protein